MKENIIIRIIFLICLMSGIGCTAMPSLLRDKPQLFPLDSLQEKHHDSHGSHAQEAEKIGPAPFTKGTLWTGEKGQNMFFTDNKARTVNDIVTIEIVESSTASKEASTKLGRSSDISASATGLFGFETKQNARVSRIKSGNSAGTSNASALDLSNILAASTQNDFDGSGITTRSGTLSGKMTALVMEVLPNGNLFIEGKRMVQVNGEEQIMILSGIIRPEDVNSNNVVLSSYIADAKIFYSGVGVIADKQHPGWMARLFDRAWPF